MQPLPCQPGPLGAPGRRRRPPPTRAARRRARSRVRPRRGNTRLGRGRLGTPPAPRRPSPETQTSTGGRWLLAVDLRQAEVSGPNLYAYVGNRPTVAVDPTGLTAVVIGGGSALINYISESFIPENQTAGTFAVSLKAGLRARGFLGQSERVQAFGFNDSLGQLGAIRETTACEPLIIIGFSGGADWIRRNTSTWRAVAGRDIDLEVLIDPVYSLFPDVRRFQRPTGVHRVVNLLQKGAPDLNGVDIPIFNGYRLDGLRGMDVEFNANDYFGISPRVGHFRLPFEPIVQSFVFDQVANAIRDHSARIGRR